MSELTGGLIQMNAHMEVSRDASIIMFVGAIAIVVFGMFAVACWPKEKKKLKAWKMFAIWLCLAVISYGAVLYAASLPREKIVRACVSGPISLELISSRYDIVNIDGKELTLRVR